jgi:hypothetical protein
MFLDPTSFFGFLFWILHDVDVNNVLHDVCGGFLHDVAT